MEEEAEDLLTLGIATDQDTLVGHLAGAMNGDTGPKEVAGTIPMTNVITTEERRTLLRTTAEAQAVRDTAITVLMKMTIQDPNTTQLAATHLVVTMTDMAGDLSHILM